jgi:replicative DNA helicase
MTVESDFYRHLTDSDSMAAIVEANLTPEILPTAELRPVYTYALDYYLGSHRERVVTIDALATYEVSAGVTLLHLLVDHEIGLDPPEMPISDVLEKLKATFITRAFLLWQKDWANKMSQATMTERLGVAQEASVSLVRLSASLASVRSQVDVREGLERRLEAYEARAAGYTSGAMLGIPEVDQYFGGLQPGEVGLIGAFAKMGKSMFADRMAWKEHARGKVVALFTLENSVAMTLDRIACTAAMVDTSAWAQGQVSAEDYARVKKYAEIMAESTTPLHVLQPDGEHRSVEAMVRQAQALDADVVIIDQLSHIRHPEPGHKPRNEIVRDIMQSLALMAQDPREPLPIWVFAQIGRKGQEEAEKRTYYRIDDFAESSETERSADIGFTLFQSGDRVRLDRALLQILFARRVPVKWWEVEWRIKYAHIKVIGEPQVNKQ